jgi:hypothetical protein
MDPNASVARSSDEVARSSDEVAEADPNLHIQTAEPESLTHEAIQHLSLAQSHFKIAAKATVFFIRSPRLAYGHFLD